jgi:hypothetical protein
MAGYQKPGWIANKQGRLQAWQAAEENHSEGGFDQSYNFHKDS